MTKIIKLYFLSLFCFLLVLSGKPSVDGGISRPVIVAGKAKITGKIISANHKANVFVNIIILHPISGENVQYKAFVDELGKFAIDVEVETNISLIGLNTNLNSKKLLFVKLKSDGVISINLTYNSDNEVENMEVTPIVLPKYWTAA